jgi:hypothetical protein
MCDFRKSPVAIQNLKTNETYTVAYCGEVSSVKDFKSVGFYYIACTGSHYIYWDGNQVHNDREDWGSPSDKYWLETGGVPPKFLTYRFIFKK